MSQQTKHTPLNRFTLSACAVAMIVAFIAGAPLWANTNEQAKNDTKPMPPEQMDHSKMDMDMDMHSMSMTGDVDYDFAASMRKHHQTAIDMSQAELKNGKNPQMLQMAQDIITAQKKEIAAFDQWMGMHKEATMGAMPKSD